jgi:ubiquinone/menaquinone biosynthesis C-methylase UbiE
MGLYDSYVLPRLTNFFMRGKAFTTERAKLVPLASGKVLEVGMGSGLNIPFYGRNVEKLFGLDTSLQLWKMGHKRVDHAPFAVEFIRSSGEGVPMVAESFDTVVTTWTLCTIPNVMSALKEIKRVLRPQGSFIFIEHGASPDLSVLAWQNRLNRFWRYVGGGCNLNRKIDDLIVAAGFRITQIEKGYITGPKPFVYLYRGVACKGPY